MPASSWILLCIIVGSAAGAGTSSAVAGALGCVVVGVALRLARHARLAAAAAILLALCAAGRALADRWSSADCVTRLTRDRRTEFVADFDLGPGEPGPATLRSRDGQCSTSGLVSARVRIRGGSWYRGDARIEPRDRAPRVFVDTARVTGERSLRPALRAAGVRRVDSVFLQDAAMARALLLADMHLIPATMRRRWSRSGLVHLLSVSGVHVAIIASAFLMIGTILRFSERRATIFALTVTALYVLVLGLPPPAVRAAVMFGSVLLAKLRQRPASEWSVVTLGAWLPVLIDPAAPLDLGWQLSVLGVVSLATAGRLSRRLGWEGGGRLGALRREVLASSVASVTSVPLIVWFFGTVSLVAPLSNLLAAPLIAIAQPTLFLALLCSPILPLARFIADAAHPLLAGLDGIAHACAAPTWAAIDLTPSLDVVLLGAAVIGALLVATLQRQNGRALLTAAMLAALLPWHAQRPWRGSGAMEMHALDVGQGDAILVRTPHGRWVVVDAGGGPPGIDHGRRTVLPYLRRLGGPVDAFILSHPHLDHVGGAPALIGALRPTHYLDGAFAGGTEAYRASLESAAVHRVHWRRVHPGDSLLLDGVTFRVLAPDSAWTASLTDANLASTIVRVEYGGAALLLVGDAELPEEEWLLANTPDKWLRADVLKVGHHGSRTSSGPAFLEAVTPSLALVSVGRGNSYGHPAPDVLQRLVRRQVRVVRTDIAGTTVVRTDGTTISVSTAAHEWSFPSHASVGGSGSVRWLP